MDLLDQIIARSQAQGMAPSYDPNLVQDPNEGENKQSLLEWLTGKKLKGGLKIIPRSPFPDVPKGASPAPAILSMAPQPGLLAPGISGSGAQAAIDSEPAGAPHVPLPVERPREVDGSDNPPASGADMAARGARGPAGEDDAAAAPIRSASSLQAGAGSQPAPAALPPQLQQGAGILGGGFMPFLQKNSNLLLALGAGMMGPYSLGEGMGRASAYAIPGHEADLKQSMTLDNQRQTYQALVQAGVPQQQAIAAIGNPKLLDALLPNYFQDQKYEIKSAKSKNSWGEENERLLAVDPRHPEKGAIDITNGTPTQIPTGAAPGVANVGGASPGSPPQSQFYGKGIDDSNFSWDKSGEDFLKQFSPGVQAEIKDRINGYQPASQNGRSPLQQRINMAAEKYGRDIGMPMDASNVQQRKQYAEGLAKLAANTPGGKARALHQGLQHFSQMSDALVDMHLSGGGLTGLEKEANIENWIKSLPAAQQERIARAQGIGQQLAGEMATLNSANGGGVHERERTRELVSDAFGSSKRAAGALRGISEIMDGGIQALEEGRDQLFPKGNAPKGSEYMTDKERAALDHINHNIKILEGKAPYPKRGATAPAQGGVAAPPPGRYVWTPDKGMQPLQ